MGWSVNWDSCLLQTKTIEFKFSANEISMQEVFNLRSVHKEMYWGEKISVTACDNNQSWTPKAREQQLYQLTPVPGQTSRREDLLQHRSLTSTEISCIPVVSLLLQTSDANTGSRWKQETTYSMGFQFDEAIGLPHPPSLVLHDAHAGRGQTHVRGQEPHNHLWWGEPSDSLQHNCWETPSGRWPGKKK